MLSNSAIKSERQLSCQKQSMNGSSPSITWGQRGNTIMLSIIFAQSLNFVKKELTDADKIEKTLSTILMLVDRILHQQYHQRNFPSLFYVIQYSTSSWKTQQNSINWFGATHYLSNKEDANKQPSRKFKGKGNHKKEGNHMVPHKGKDIPKDKIDKWKLSQKYGCYGYITKKCCTPSHLVDLYLKNDSRDRPNQGYETHLNFQPSVGMEDVAPYNFPAGTNMAEASCSKLFLPCKWQHGSSSLNLLVKKFGTNQWRGKIQL